MSTASKSILIIVLLFFIPVNSFAQKDSQQQKIGKALEQYGVIAGSWFLDKKCKILDKNKSAEFEWYVANINIALSKIVKTEMLRTTQSSAQKVSNSDKYACDQNSSELVNVSFSLAKKLSYGLTKKNYSKDTSANYFLDRHSFVYLGMKLDDKCDVLSDNIRAEVKKVYDEVTKKIVTKFPNKKILSGNRLKKSLNNIKNMKCNNITKKTVIASIGELRALEKELEN